MRKSKEKITGQFDPIVYGLDGICQLFNCGKTTAWRLKKFVIGEACAVQGRTIVVDAEKALKLFGCPNPARYIKKVVK